MMMQKTPSMKSRSGADPSTLLMAQDGWYKGMTSLHRSANQGNLQRVQQICDAGGDVNRADDFGSTGMTIAAYRGHLKIVKYLCEKGADKNKGDKSRSTPLFMAAAEGHLAIVSYLCEQEADINRADSTGISPLQIACHRGHLDIVIYLCEKGANVNKATDGGMTALSIASLQGYDEIVRCLINFGAILKKPSEAKGITAASIASHFGCTEVAQYLTEHERAEAAALAAAAEADSMVDTNAMSAQKPVETVDSAPDDERGMPEKTSEKPQKKMVTKASFHEDDVVFKIGDDNDDDIEQMQKFRDETPCGSTEPPSVSATPAPTTPSTSPGPPCEAGSAAQSRRVSAAGSSANLPAKIDIDEVNHSGTNRLHRACNQGKIEHVRKLCEPDLHLYESGADVNRPDRSGSTPLCIATFRDHRDLVKYLCEMGADINKADHYRSTPLYIAAAEGHTEVVRYLCERGALVNKADCCGTTPLHVSAHKGYLEIVKCLVEHSADKNKTSQSGATPMFIAAHENQLEVVQYLCRQGAGMDQVDRNGSTATSIAAHFGYEGMVDYLTNQARFDIICGRNLCDMQQLIRTVARIQVWLREQKKRREEAKNSVWG
jgi:ankyrin repeat protein